MNSNLDSDGLPIYGSDLLQNSEPAADTVAKIRRDNLIALTKKAGSIAEINGRLGRKRQDPYLYAVYSGQRNKNGGSIRSLGFKMCAEIERAFSLESGAMSTPNALNNPVITCESIPAPAQSRSIEPDLFKPAAASPDCVPIKILESVAKTKTHIYLDSRDLSGAFPGRSADDFRGAVIHSSDMAPEFMPGDRLLIDITDAAPAPGLIVLDISGRVILRRVRSSLDGSLRIYADSMPGESMPLDTAQHKILGRAVYHWRGRKI